MSNSSTPIFVPSRSSSPIDNAGNTPYIVTSPPPESPTDSEMALPHKQMIEHIARILNIEEEEVRRQFPSNCSLLSIDVSPPRHHIPIPDTLPSYPGDEFANIVDPSYPNSPPSSPEPLPVPPPHETMTRASPFDDRRMAVVLYDKLAAQEALTQAQEANAERQTPSPTGPQPGVHPGPGWIENWTETNTCHYFVIPDDEEDVIAPFVCYDMTGPFPELLATNGRNCTVHSHPLHARADNQPRTPLSPRDELLFVDKLVYSSAIDYAVRQEEDPTLAGEIKHFRSHHKKATKLAQEMGCIHEALETERQALYRSSNRLAAANAPQRVLRHIGHTLRQSPYFSAHQIKKIHIAIQNRAVEAWGSGRTACEWCGKMGHHIEHCHSIGYCRHCSRRGHTGMDCMRPHDMCQDGGLCKVYPNHPNFENRHCAAEDEQYYFNDV